MSMCPKRALWGLPLSLCVFAGSACEPSSGQPDAIPDQTGGGENGARFEAVEFPTTGIPPNLFDVWGDGEGRLWVVGEKGYSAHFDGFAWRSSDTGVSGDLRSVHGVTDPETGASQVWAVGTGGSISRWAAGAWTPETIVLPEDRPDLATVDLNAVGVSPVYTVAVGAGGVVLRRDAATGTFAYERSGTVETLNGVFQSEGSAAWAVGNLGVILYYDPGANEWSRRRVDGLTDPMRGVWGRSADDVYVVGLDGTVLRGGPGGDFQRVEGAPQVFLRDVFGTTMEDAWAVGWGGTIVRLNGYEATPIESFTLQRLEGVWGMPLDPPTEEDEEGNVTYRSRFFVVGVTATVLGGP